jgi:hypothetical protein
MDVQSGQSRVELGEIKQLGYDRVDPLPSMIQNAQLAALDFTVVGSHENDAPDLVGGVRPARETSTENDPMRVYFDDRAPQGDGKGQADP